MNKLPKPYFQSNGITLYHGDAREIAEQIGMVDMIFTDPPFGHGQNDRDLFASRAKWRGKKPNRKIANDGPEANDLARWLFDFAARRLRCCCCCCCCGGGGGPDLQFARWSLWMDERLEFKQMIVWDKGPMGMGWHYRRSYENVLVAQKGKGKCHWYDTTHKIENIIRPGAHGIRKIIPQKTDHPTPKPVALPRLFIGLHTKPGDLVFDPFAGGGSTLVAAAQLRRRAIGVELEERWCEMAARKIEQEGAFDAAPPRARVSRTLSTPQLRAKTSPRAPARKLNTVPRPTPTPVR